MIQTYVVNAMRTSKFVFDTIKTTLSFSGSLLAVAHSSMSNVAQGEPRGGRLPSLPAQDPSSAATSLLRNQQRVSHSRIPRLPTLLGQRAECVPLSMILLA